MDLLASTFLDLVPRYDHIVAGKMYNSLLARRQLLEQPRRQMLPDKISELGMFADNSKDFLHDSFGVEDYPPIEYPSAMSALEVGQKTLLVLAAVNIIEDFATSPRAGHPWPASCSHPAQARACQKCCASASGRSLRHSCAIARQPVAPA